jgi:hypothetical protein
MSQNTTAQANNQFSCRVSFVGAMIAAVLNGGNNYHRGEARRKQFKCKNAESKMTGCSSNDLNGAHD